MHVQLLFHKNRQIINLQYGNVEDELKNMNDEGYKVYSYKNIDLFNNIDDCISALKNLDVFVTVSNTTAHIAAALGIKTILICPKTSSTYFYWSNINNSTLWYKNVTIFKIKDSINDTIKEVDKLLKKL